jgi:uncharacterized protein (TIGR02594 family)
MKGIDIALKYEGLQQVRDNEKLRAFLQQESVHGDIAINPADTAWCAAFVNACERTAGNKGTGKLNAQSFLTYGMAINTWTQSQHGDIVVFHFPFDSPANGHVTYLDSWDDTDNLILCLGGNQNHMVCVSRYLQDYIQAIRRPV